MFRRYRNRNQPVNLGGTISVGPYSVVRLSFGERTHSWRSRRHYVFVPIVGLFDSMAHLIYECLAQVDAGNYILLDRHDGGYEGGAMLEFVAGTGTRPESLHFRAIAELELLYEAETGVRLA